MMYELRTSTPSGRLPDLNRRFRGDHPWILQEARIDVVGFWTNELGGLSDELILDAGPLPRARGTREKCTLSSPTRTPRQVAETEKNGPS